MQKEIYYIGGSPCSGKSAIAEALTDRYGFYYFKVDDYLDRYLQLTAEAGLPLAQKMASMSPDEMWLRDPAVLQKEEVAYYEIIFSYVCKDIDALADEKPIIAEGAAFMPKLMKRLGIGKNRYICIVPDADFQNAKYAERPWIQMILEGNSKPEKAFANWMQRDQLFASHVLKEAEEACYETIITTQNTPLDANICKVVRVFELNR